LSTTKKGVKKMINEQKETNNIDSFETLVKDFEKDSSLSNIKNIDLFDVSTNPSSKYFYKRSAYKDLGFNILNFLKHGLRVHAFLTGSKGSGKTTTVDSLKKEIKDSENYDFNYYYVNCNGLRRSYDVITKRLFKDKNFYGKDAITEIKSIFEKETKKTILVLDEIDNLEDDHLLYHLSRDPAFKNIQLLLITKKPKYLEKISADVLSSLGLQFFHFDDYDTPELELIFKLRAEEGFYNYNLELLKRIAESNCRNAHSDVRVGISTLRDFFGEKSYSNLDEESQVKMGLKVDHLIKKEYYKLKEQIIQKLPGDKLLALFCANKKDNNLGATNYFNRLAVSNISSRQFLRIIYDLENLDLLKIIKIRDGRSNKLKFISELSEDNFILLMNLLNKRTDLINEKLSFY
jgi:Cdc6-like AAA superfamily ATPase